MKYLVVIDCQNDFVRKDGKLAVPGAEGIIKNILELIRVARENKVSVVYTQDWHPADADEFKLWPPHCIQDTDGAKIIDELAPGVGEVIIQKNELSAWSNPLAKTTFDDASLIYVCGCATEYCVRAFAIAANEFGIVPIIVDAIAGVDEIPNVPRTKGSVAKALMDMSDNGCQPMFADQVIDDMRSGK